MSSRKYCRLCLSEVFETSTNNYYVESQSSDVLLKIFPGMNTKLTETVKLCEECFNNINFAINVKESFHFKKRQFENIEILYPSCTCCFKEQPRNAIFLNKNNYPSNLMKTMVEIALTEYKFDIRLNPLICFTCWTWIKKIYSFKKDCFKVEETIKNYCIKYNLSVLTDGHLSNLIYLNRSQCYPKTGQENSREEGIQLQKDYFSITGEVYPNLCDERFCDMSRSNDVGNQKIDLEKYFEDTDDVFDEIVDRKEHKDEDVIVIDDDDPSSDGSSITEITEEKFTVSDVRCIKNGSDETDSCYSNTYDVHKFDDFETQVQEPICHLSGGHEQPIDFSVDRKNEETSLEEDQEGTEVIKSVRIDFNHSIFKQNLTQASSVIVKTYRNSANSDVNDNRVILSSDFDDFQSELCASFDDSPYIYKNPLPNDCHCICNRNEESYDDLLKPDDDCFEVIQDDDAFIELSSDEYEFSYSDSDIRKKRTKPHKPFKSNKLWCCHICIAEFSWKCTLKRHLLIHEDPSNKFWPFACKKCPFRARYIGTLTRHKVEHQKYEKSNMCTREKMFLCPYCFVVYSEREEINGHMREHELSGNKVACVECMFATQRRNVLRNHYKRYHGPASDPSVCHSVI